MRAEWGLPEQLEWKGIGDEREGREESGEKREKIRVGVEVGFEVEVELGSECQVQQKGKACPQPRGTT